MPCQRSQFAEERQASREVHGGASNSGCSARYCAALWPQLCVLQLHLFLLLALPRLPPLHVLLLRQAARRQRLHIRCPRL